MSLVDSTTIDDSFSEATTTRATTIGEEYTSTLPSVTDITESTLISLDEGFRETSCQESESDKGHFTVPFTNDTETTVSSLTTKKQKDEDLGQLIPTNSTNQVNKFKKEMKEESHLIWIFKKFNFTIFFQKWIFLIIPKS